MSDFVIEKVDTVNVKVRCERGLAKEMSDFFTFKVPGYKFMLNIETRYGMEQ